MGANGQQRTADRDGSADRLVSATLSVLEHQGSAAASVRTIAQAAGLPPSSLYHHFGAVEHLYEAAQNTLILRARQWCAERLQALAQLGDLPLEAFPRLMAALLDEWAHAHRPAMLAWQECRLLAARDPRYGPGLLAWSRLWAEFWEAVCARCGRSGRGWLTALVFHSEGLLHLMAWDRVIDRAALEDFCVGWACWLAGAAAPEGACRRIAREAALRATPPLPIAGGLAARIADAAADVVAQKGIRGLTHRAVAAQAGLTLGVVSHNFRTSGDLAHAAFEAVYHRVASTSSPRAAVRPPAEDMIDEIARYQQSSSLLLARDELLIAAARDPALRAFAPPLRYTRGRTSGTILTALLGPDRPVSPLDAALMSATIAGLRHATAGADPGSVRADTERAIGEVCALLASSD